jgi:hypothetical protein
MVVMMKCFIVVTLVLIMSLGAVLPVTAESTDVRLARMEEKLDYLIEQNKNRDADYKTMDVRVGAVERKLDKHSSTFAVMGWVGGAAWAVILLLLSVFFRRWFEKKPVPTCEGG